MSPTERNMNLKSYSHVTIYMFPRPNGTTKERERGGNWRAFNIKSILNSALNRIDFSLWSPGGQSFCTNEIRERSIENLLVMCSEIVQDLLIIFPFAEVNKIWIWFLRHNSFAVLLYNHYLKFVLPDHIIHTEFLNEKFSHHHILQTLVVYTCIWQQLIDSEHYDDMVVR